jgi:hypothetical protein
MKYLHILAFIYLEHFLLFLQMKKWGYNKSIKQCTCTLEKFSCKIVKILGP